MPIFRSYHIMLKKKLLYTGITRAKEKLILMGDVKSFQYGVESIEEPRQSILKDKIISKILKSEEKTDTIKKPDFDSKKIYDKNIPFEYLGEDFGDEVSPYDFMKK